MRRSLGSQLSAGINHQLRIPKMVTTTKIGADCHSNRGKIYQISMPTKKAIAVGKAYEIECLSGDGEKEGRNFNRKHDGVEECGCDVEISGEMAQLDL